MKEKWSVIGPPFFPSKFVCWISTIATNRCGYSIFYYRFVCVYAQPRYLPRRFRCIWQTTTPRIAISARAIRTPRKTGKLFGSSGPPCAISGEKKQKKTTTTNKQTNKQKQTKNKTKKTRQQQQPKSQEHLNHISYTLIITTTIIIIIVVVVTIFHGEVQ